LISVLSAQFFIYRVTSWPSFISSTLPLIFSGCFVILFLSVGLRDSKVLFFFNGGDFCFYSGLKKAYSFASFGLCQGLCSLQMCVLLWKKSF
jgi:hypothetical protein